MTPLEIEERKQYERALYDRVKDYVKTQMSEEDKDRIYRIAQNNPVNYEILKDNPNYKTLRDNAIARDLLGDALAYEIPLEKLNKKFVDKYIEDWDKVLVSERYRDNAIKGLKSRFPEQYAMILLEAEATDIDPMEFMYVGGNVYQYRNMIISFQNSPVTVEVRIF